MAPKYELCVGLNKGQKTTKITQNQYKGDRKEKGIRQARKKNVSNDKLDENNCDNKQNPKIFLNDETILIHSKTIESTVSEDLSDFNIFLLLRSGADTRFVHWLIVALISSIIQYLSSNRKLTYY